MCCTLGGNGVGWAFCDEGVLNGEGVLPAVILTTSADSSRHDMSSSLWHAGGENVNFRSIWGFE